MFSESLGRNPGQVRDRCAAGRCVAGAWQMRGRCVAGAWQVRGRRVAGAWQVHGSCVPSAWQVRARCGAGARHILCRRYARIKSAHNAVMHMLMTCLFTKHTITFQMGYCFQTRGRQQAPDHNHAHETESDSTPI